MNVRKFFLYFFVGVFVLCMLFVISFYFMQFLQIIDEVSDLKFYPEKVPDRQVGLIEKFSLLWSKKTEEGNQYNVFTQIFVPDENSIVYVTRTALISLDYMTGDLRWSVATPLNSFFYYYADRFFSLTKYEENILFAPDSALDLPIECSYSDSSTLRVYDPHTGQKVWEFSYPFTEPDTMTFKDNSVFIDGFSITSTGKYIPELEINIDTGEVMGFTCQNYNDVGYSSKGRTEGILSSEFKPVYDDLSWKLLKEGQLAMVPEGTRLTMIHPESKQPLGFIEFLGSELNPYDVQMVFHNNILIIYLNDSDQFFAFRVDE